MHRVQGMLHPPQALASLTEIEHGLYAGIGLWAHHSRWWQLLLIIIRTQLELAGKKFDEFATAVRQDGEGLLLLCIKQGKAPADQPGLLEQKLDLPTSNVCNEFHSSAKQGWAQIPLQHTCWGQSCA
jgi:hypothetical protein